MPRLFSPTRARLLAALTVGGVVNAANAWVYPEHRDIALYAVASLDSAHPTAFEQLWTAARAGDQGRLCRSGAEQSQALAPSCIDWAAMSALGGDHSCSAREMFEVVRTSDWVLRVAAVAAQLKVDLAGIPVAAQPYSAKSATTVFSDLARDLADKRARAQRINALRRADLNMQRADSQYATRAGANSAHFLLARPNIGMSLEDYAELTLRPGSEISAIGMYSSYHLSALQKASRLAHETLAADERNALARAVLADEAFALLRESIKLPARGSRLCSR